jgi:hypothetical protein
VRTVPVAVSRRAGRERAGERARRGVLSVSKIYSVVIVLLLVLVLVLVQYTRYMYINDPLTATKANTHTHTDRALQHASAPERA